jgi:glycine amidinotransferase
MSIWTNWDPLEEVIVGDCYNPGDFDWAIDNNIKESFNLILKETKEDLNNLAKLLESLGVKVYRPSINVFSGPIDLCGMTVQNPVAPLVPRDQFLVYGDTIFQSYTSFPDRYFESLSYYEIFKKLFDEGHNWISMPPPNGLVMKPHQYYTYITQGEEIYKKLSSKLLWHTATMFKCGDALIYNNRGPGTEIGLEWFKRNASNVKFIPNENTYMNGWGHIDHGFFMTDDDTVFCKEIDYVPVCLRNKKIFEVGPVKEDNIYSVLAVKWREHYKNFEKISMDGINKWLNQWKGFHQHVHFDTNVLVVDSKNVIFASDVPKKLFELLDKQGIKAHVCQQRHYFFWDGGIHCFTLDVKRKGECRSVVQN